MRFRTITYNIHRAISVDRRFRLNRIIKILAHHKADIVLLQEVDMGVPRSGKKNLAQKPARVLGYLKDMVRGRPQHYLGHNPAGGVMILMLLASLIGTVATGLLMLGDGGGELWEEVHEFFANFTLFLVVFHVAGVVIGGMLHRENLVRAMITGRKQAGDGEAS